MDKTNCTATLKIALLNNVFRFLHLQGNMNISQQANTSNIATVRQIPVPKRETNTVLK